MRRALALASLPVLLATLISLLLATHAGAFDLAGAWYVLVHYRDAAQPDLAQWEDRLFVFEPAGDGLRFRDYPTVRFDDASGRFESVGGEAARVLGFWEPSESQRGEIERGLGVDPRGATAKLLEPAPGGFRSRGARAQDSVRFVGFESRVEVDLAGPAPGVIVTDSLGSSAVQGMQGRTEYRGERVSADGRAVEGRYDRDGRRIGSFRLVRAGAPRGQGEPPPRERASAAEQRAAALAALERALGPRVGASERLPERFAGGDAAERERLRAALRAELETGAAAVGTDPRGIVPELERLAGALERLYVEEGRSREEIGRLLADGKVGR